MNRTTFVIRLLVLIAFALVIFMWVRPSTEWLRLALTALVLVGAAGVLSILELTSAKFRFTVSVGAPKLGGEVKS